MNYGNSSTATRFDRCSNLVGVAALSTVALSGLRCRTRLKFSSYLRLFLVMADVSDPKINEGAFCKSLDVFLFLHKANSI